MPVFLQRSDDQLLAQVGRDVYALNVSNGTRSKAFQVANQEILIADADNSFLATEVKTIRSAKT
jgi:hypothetical protein